MPDYLHPNAKGYDIWAAAIKPILTEWLGAPKPAEAK
jgi:lysophospholipase L1-like esterase